MSNLHFSTVATLIGLSGRATVLSRMFLDMACNLLDYALPLPYTVKVTLATQLNYFHPAGRYRHCT